MSVTILNLLFAPLAMAQHAQSTDQLCEEIDYALNLEQILPKIGGDPCFNEETAIVADVDNRFLFLCENGSAQAGYPIAIGSKGFPKRIEGDKKTPIGIYSLGPSRRSNNGFGLFIPISYPTLEERERGLTGSALGIHGPPRNSRCSGLNNVSWDWTAGCLALPSDPAIVAVARFSQQFPEAPVRIFSNQLTSDVLP